MAILIIACLLILASVTLVSLSLFPKLLGKLFSFQQKKEQVVTKQMDEMFYTKGSKRISSLYVILPVALGLVAFLFLQNFIIAIAAAAVGLVIPNLIIKGLEKKRKQLFSQQLLDAIMLLSSCLKGGLSLLQSFEVVSEEMPAPMSQEIGLVVRENKVGVPLEDSLSNINNRINTDELSLVINSIKVARETGGDLIKVFSRLSTTIRDNRKLKESIKTLTLQGRMQGYIMSALPILFVLWVLSTNPHHFDIMVQTDLGKLLLVAAVILQVVGMFLLNKFSKINI